MSENKGSVSWPDFYDRMEAQEEKLTRAIRETEGRLCEKLEELKEALGGCQVEHNGEHDRLWTAIKPLQSEDVHKERRIKAFTVWAGIIAVILSQIGAIVVALLIRNGG